MTMNESDRTTKAPRTPTPEPIKVKELWFCVVNGRDIPLPTSAGGQAKVIAGERNGLSIEISYEPWQRHHRVRAYDIANPKERKLTREFCVPESWALYIPADSQ